MRSVQSSEFGHGRFVEWLFRAAAFLSEHLISRSELRGPIRRILILQLQQLGDSMVFTPTLRAIRHRYPKARIDVLCSPVSYELYKKSPDVDRVRLASWVQHPTKHLRLAANQIGALRRERYDVVVADVNHISARYIATAFLSGARNRIGFDVANRGFLLTKPLQRPANRDFVTCNLLLADAFGVDAPSRRLVAPFDAEDDAHVDRLLSSLPRAQRLIAIHPTSNWQSKTWFSDRWVNIVHSLANEHDATIVFVGTRGERENIDQILAQLDVPAFSMAGETSLGQLAALVKRCDLFIGTDSGPRHVAAGTGCPRVILMSAQDRAERWQFGDEREVVLRTDPPCSPCLLSYCSHRQCMVGITEAMVLAAAGAMLAEGSPGSPFEEPKVSGTQTHGQLAGRRSL